MPFWEPEEKMRKNIVNKAPKRKQRHYSSWNPIMKKLEQTKTLRHMIIGKQDLGQTPSAL